MTALSKRGRYHEHEFNHAEDFTIQHNHDHEDAMHEHWTNATGRKFVYYPHINKLLTAETATSMLNGD